MASSQIHCRSMSLPSRLHPLNSTEFEAELTKFKSSQTPSLSTSLSLTSDSIQSGLLKLAELYSSIGELTQSPSTQRSIKEAGSIQNALEGSIELLDSCSSIKELVQMMKENVQALQSALRRKASIQNDVASYICSRKKANKCIRKSLKTLKNFESRINVNASNISSSGDEERFVGALREVYGLTVSVFKCCLLFFSSSSIKSGSWNLVSRLMISKSADYNVVTEVGCMDLALSNLQGRVELKIVDKQMVQKSLQNLDSCFEGIEMGLERMFRQLVQSRVNLLNIVTNH